MVGGSPRPYIVDGVDGLDFGKARGRDGGCGRSGEDGGGRGEVVG